MKTKTKYFTNVLEINLLFIAIIFILPYVLAILGHRLVSFTLSMLNIEIFSVFVSGGTFKSSVGAMGLIITTIIAIIFTVIKSSIIKRKSN